AAERTAAQAVFVAGVPVPAPQRVQLLQPAGAPAQPDTVHAQPVGAVTPAGGLLLPTLSASGVPVLSWQPVCGPQRDHAQSLPGAVRVPLALQQPGVSAVPDIHERVR